MLVVADPKYSVQLHPVLGGDAPVRPLPLPKRTHRDSPSQQAPHGCTRTQFQHQTARFDGGCLSGLLDTPLLATRHLATELYKQEFHL
jgi:hypothetical protein